MVEKRKIKVLFRTEREARNVLREIHSRAVIRTDNGIYVELYPKTIDILKTTPSVSYDGEFYTAEDREPKPPKKPKGTWGGARPNSGAKPKGEVARITKSFMADVDVVKVLDEHKGTASDFINDAIRFWIHGTIFGYKAYKGKGYTTHVYSTEEARNNAADNETDIDDIELFSIQLGQ